MIQVGRVCLKLAGRDAGQLAVVLSEPEKNFVLVDGNVRRKRCNIKHLEPTPQLLDVKEEASTSEVHKAMSSAGLEVKKSESRKKEKPAKKAEKKKK